MLAFYQMKNWFTEQEDIVKIPLVKRVKIRDFKVIKEADIEFGPKLNIITGKSGGGKTTVLDCLTESLHLEKLSKRELIEFQIQQEINPGCLLIDNLLYALSSESLLKILKKLENCGSQVIVTLHKERLKEVEGKIQAKIIDVDKFKLKS